ncbi:MAG: 1-acyl-sn-glycerol-3-phosphate acyltransferase [Alphaproteobacteria bacterium]|jgi:1-acyl-sn-glycerol-3-phosphate acyltransferase|nr:1-acyl-sn-glycerol-3-phosphate acyltransferase [Alphaproteobacteria bacterium]PPR12789.1 MAG: hypothetical protein CFH42_01764 [Alphaproteobacteria bacterium MarineAlpha12_Bin1]
MQKLLTIIFLILFYFWTVFLGLICIPFLTFPYQTVMALGRVWIHGVFFLLRSIVGIKHKVIGSHLVPNGPVIFAVKHQSEWDTLAVNLLIKDPAIILKKELLNIPLFGWYLKRSGHIAIDRKGGSKTLKSMLLQSSVSIKAARSIVIFPEGTRTQPGQKGVYHPGIIALYEKEGLAVVPIALNSGLFWSRNPFTKYRGTITFQFLPAISPGLDRREFIENLESSVENASELLYKNAREEFFSKKCL